VKLYYLNDEQKPITVRIMDSRYDPTTGLGDIYTTLKSCEGRTFEILLEEGQTLYIKKWPGIVMFSGWETSSLEQFEQERLQRDGA
jgi:hypothetical protein